ncbi:MAG: hypothetical protein A3I75_03395 [Deltaproteobacteria bacterium RIFCSPLOWO2_02_FULL_50_16]|nr:MAG: hypothetical protein A2053_02920 [Deltaproteobacteria bacterium GWA2_50_8]OGQ26670.1 MAG: hypothetical protein A3B79_06000 [Deltaproteobacteria bacterium RIFCSPHIGHO2_02_FULL_50_15]OGQ57786.1 MAG: hypothetical protein A3I75_03395 [Deltaproteobacteria bacterium RIFCSPLOWO2_02_FULL_50_16]OGQ68811.1 MAG: hypothetical protein A3F89_07280 [Deltaproteobacteria bacterium RIFCSPLOWO2_12_FULL_50_11]
MKFFDFSRKSRLFLVFFCLQVSSLWAFQSVYLSPKEALRQVFHASKVVVSEKRVLDAEQAAWIVKKSGLKPPQSEWTFYLGKTDEKIDGYALIDHQVGKTEPITFMTVINPDGRVRDVMILVYRETHGSEVRHKNFLRQFYGKEAHHPVRLGQDIDVVSGATLSSRALAVGVKRALLLWEIFYGKHGSITAR